MRGEEARQWAGVGLWRKDGRRAVGGGGRRAVGGRREVGGAVGGRRAGAGGGRFDLVDSSPGGASLSMMWMLQPVLTVISLNALPCEPMSRLTTGTVTSMSCRAIPGVTWRRRWWRR